MVRHHPRIFRSLGAAAVVFNIAAIGGCGSDAGPAPSRMQPPGSLAAAHPPPPDPPPRPQSKKECDACAGIWAVHGIEPAESCICRTDDAGELCADGAECQGQCLVDEASGFQVMDESTPPRGFYTGTCSTYDTTFGCHLLIPPGIDDQLPLPADEAAQHICID
jgi:hypothetical protein